MNLRALAASDLKDTLANTAVGATEFSLVDPSNKSYTLAGFVGDIGFLLDDDGLPIAGRSVVASYPLADLKDTTGAMILPSRGWKLRYKDLSMKEWTLSVLRFEPDRTIGIGRLILTLKLEL